MLSDFTPSQLELIGTIIWGLIVLLGITILHSVEIQRLWKRDDERAEQIRKMRLLFKKVWRLSNERGPEQ